MPISDARVIGAGRAGGALTLALARAGWTVDGPLGRTDDVRHAADGTRRLVLAVPDAAVGPVAAAIEPGEAVVLHISGSLGLDVLAGHDRRAAVHPLVALPDAERGAGRLRGAWFAVAGDAAGIDIVDTLGGRSVSVPDADRASYHAAAVVAANHLVALMGQVERIAEGIGVPLEAYLALARGALDDVSAVGPAAALTGPVSRGDWETVARHLEALPAAERPAYALLADAARRLHEVPA